MVRIISLFVVVFPLALIPTVVVAQDGSTEPTIKDSKGRFLPQKFPTKCPIDVYCERMCYKPECPDNRGASWLFKPYKGPKVICMCGCTYYASCIPKGAGPCLDGKIYYRIKACKNPFLLPID